jgi:DNA-binding transcriptional MerR regulator
MAYVTRKQLSERFSVHPLTIRNWERSGLLPVLKMPGRTVRYRVQDVDKLEELFLTGGQALKGVRRG